MTYKGQFVEIPDDDSLRCPYQAQNWRVRLSACRLGDICDTMGIQLPLASRTQAGSIGIPMEERHLD